MDEYEDRMAVEISKLSRNIFISVFVFALLNIFSEFLQFKWLVAAFGVLFVLTIFISWITPGVFVMFGKPWLAYAWLRGVNPIWYSVKSWVQLSSGTKVGVIVQSMVTFVFVSIALVIILINVFKK